jgi:hypothetical protein
MMSARPDAGLALNRAGALPRGDHHRRVGRKQLPERWRGRMPTGRHGHRTA